MMRELLNPALPEVRTPLPAVPPPPTEPQPPSSRPAPRLPAGRRPRAPRIERIACWSARHRVTVIVGWLVLGAAALLAGQLLGTQSQPQYDPGQAGQAEQTLHQLGVVSPPAESVLIQARAGSPGYAHDPAMRGAGGSYLQATGTSPAAAFVAGVAALIRSAYPRLSPAQVEQALVSLAQHRPAGRYSPATGFGEVDAAAALRAAGRLAATRPARGLGAGSHFGGVPPGPVPVVRRDAARIALLLGLAVAGGVGFLAALAVLGRLMAGRRRGTGTVS